MPKGLNHSLRSHKGLPEKMMPLCDLTEKKDSIRWWAKEQCVRPQEKHSKNAEGKKPIFEKINKIDKTSKTNQVKKGRGEH